MKPRIFVSSTFYDLKYIREDLSNFIKAHDFEPIMFEDGDIGYTPGKPLDTSCYKTMHSADMVLLIIGGNYGSPATGEDKAEFKEYMSVTRKEFKEALEIGVPIYAFIDSKVYVEYEIYEANIKSIEDDNNYIKFRNVKDINVFKFIREIKGTGNIVITEFEKIVQIKDFLSKQWSDMFKKYLDILKEENADKKLESTVDDMKNLIKRMDTMLDNIGKKVLGNGENISYDDVVKEMDITDICDALANTLKTNEPVRDNKTESVSRYLESFKAFLGKIETRDIEKLDMDESFRMLRNEVYKRGMSIFSISDDLLLQLNLLRKLMNDNVYLGVQAKLRSDKYYNRIFYY